MEPQEIEDMLYHRAIHSKVRPPVAQRSSSLAYNRVVAGGVVAGAALVCTLAMPSPAVSPAASNRGYSGQLHPQLTETRSKQQSDYHAQISADTLNSVTASLAMSHVGN